MQRASWIRFKSRTAGILLDIGEQLECLDEGFLHPASSSKYGAYTSRKLRIQRERHLHDMAFKRLVKRDIIRTKKYPDRIEVALTPYGIHQLYRLRLRKADPLPRGEYCIVIFDIPEKHARLRNNLRRVLKASGFTCLQKSVWVSENDVSEMLSSLLSVAGARGWVRILDATERKLSLKE